MNKGLSGSCLCEREVADYLAELSADVLSPGDWGQYGAVL